MGAIRAVLSSGVRLSSSIAEAGRLLMVRERSFGDLDDSALIGRILEGEEAGHREILRRYSDLVFSVSRKVLNSEQLAEEAAQDTFLKAFRSLHEFRGDSRFSTWLYRIAWTTAISKRRTEVRHRSDDLEVAESLPAGTQEGDGFSKLAAGNRQQLIRECLERLKPEEAVVITLFYLQEQTLSEIAEIVGSNVNAVKVRLHRARKHLRTIMHQTLKEEVREL